MARSSRSKAEVRQVKNTILDAAARVFGRRGFQVITMADLAAEAGYSTASIYNYFPDKDALLVGLVDRSIEQFMEAAQTEFPGSVLPAARLEWLALRLLQVAHDNLGLMTMLLSHGMASQGGGSANVVERYFSVHQHFMDAITPHISATSTLGDEVAAQLGYQFVGILRTESFTWLMGTPPTSLEPIAARLTRFFLGGVAALGGDAQ